LELVGPKPEDFREPCGLTVIGNQSPVLDAANVRRLNARPDAEFLLIPAASQALGFDSKQCFRHWSCAILH
jgi:hypothetical protein